MSSKSPLDEWLFLVGDWKGGAKDQFEETGEIRSTATFSIELDGKAIMGIHETKQGDNIINQSIGILFYDVLNKTFRRKSFFSYGFVNNEVAYRSSSNEIRFTVKSEPSPPQFKGIRWRSYITKISPIKIGLGLEQAKKGDKFEPYGETVLNKIQ